MFATIRPYQYVALRLPADQVRVEQIIPNTLVYLGKYGSFHTNQIIGRPYHLTFEILDRPESTDGRELRVVTAAEIHADALIEQSETPAVEDGATPSVHSDEQVSKSNVNIFDDPLTQKLTMAEIEALKQDGTASSKDLIAKIMASHSNLDQKTAFSLAKYTLRKNRKYLRRFCVLPLDVATLADWMMNEKDFAKVMEIRNETLGLIGSWANVHASGVDLTEALPAQSASRYLVVDDTGGLVIAALAERMGVLYPAEEDMKPSSNDDHDEPYQHDSTSSSQPKRRRHPITTSARHDTLTAVHANTQPNLSLLRYFSFDATNPSPTHPLHTHLKTISWLQLLEPKSDPSYANAPEDLSPEVFSALKSSKRATHHRKRRRWERTRDVVHDTQAGGFDGLVIASFTSATSILHHLVPLLAGGRQIVVYAPHVEPLLELMDVYSTARRTAFLNTPPENRCVPSENFPVDPTLLLGPMLQTARVRRWQVLPGRTHPLMMGRGGAEGYIFVATRVVPAEGRVSARGRGPRRTAKKTNTQAADTREGSLEPPEKKVKVEGDDDAEPDEVPEAQSPELMVDV